MKKLLLSIAVLFTLAGCSAPTTAHATADVSGNQAESQTEEKAEKKKTYTKVHIFDNPKGGLCVRIKDWEFARASYGSIYGVKVWFSDDSGYKGGQAFLPQGTYMLLDGECPLCGD